MKQYSSYLVTFLSVLFVLFLSGGCSDTSAPQTLSALTTVTGTIDEYEAQYNERFSIGPRPAEDAFASAEAYLSRYQPGPEPRIFQSTYLYDRNGELLAEIFDEGRRRWVPLDQISPDFINAIIATEDASFYRNSGVDVLRVIAALLQNQEAGTVVSGASTITMQLARNIFFPPEERLDQTTERKIMEAFLARDLTQLFRKDELLEMYVNLIYFGHLAYGPEAAAQIYFNKSAAELNLAESTMLAGMPQQPSRLDPLLFFDAAKDRQRIVLNLMVRHEYLSQAEADRAYDWPIKLNRNQDLPPIRAPHFVHYVTHELRTQMGVEPRRAGFQVWTSLDLRVQSLAQRIVLEKVAQFQPVYNLSNSALVALKPGRGEILAMVGSADYNNNAIDGQVNVTVSRRQPGSAIKPLLFALAFDDGLISPGSILWDVPVKYSLDQGANTTYQPVNYDERFHGPVTARIALANSYNIPAVKLLQAVGIDRMLEGANTMGVRSLNQEDTWYGLSLVLGSGEVTLLDLTGAFHTLANEGRRDGPRAILTLWDHAGQGIDPKYEEQVQAVSPATAYLTTHVLSDNQARTPAFGINSPLQLSKPAAVKTGTTNDWRDNWTIGYTRYLVAGVWAGNSDGTPMRDASGVVGAAPIWHDFMEALLDDPELLAILDIPENETDQDTDLWQFPMPSSVHQRDVCPEDIYCPPGGEYFSSDWLRHTGMENPLSDSIVNAPSVPVLAWRGDNNMRIGYCVQLDGTVRSLMNVPSGIGRSPSGSLNLDGSQKPIPTLPEPAGLPVPDITNRSASEDVPTFEEADLEAFRIPLSYNLDEVSQALAWGVYQGLPLNLGLCNDLWSVLPDRAVQISVNNTLYPVQTAGGKGDSVRIEYPNLPRVAIVQSVPELTPIPFALQEKPTITPTAPIIVEVIATPVPVPIQETAPAAAILRPPPTEIVGTDDYPYHLLPKNDRGDDD